MLKRIIFLLSAILLCIYLVLEIFLSGYFSPKEIYIKKKKFIFPNNYIVTQVNKEGKIYNLFEIPFLNFLFIPTKDFEDSGIHLENYKTKNYFVLYFAEYANKLSTEYFKLLEKDDYKITIRNNCYIATKENKDNISMYLYKDNILYHYIGTQTNYEYSEKQICEDT